MEKQLVVDEDLLEQAERLTGVREPETLIREALTALIERESARRLAKLGGSDPELRDIPRRRVDAA